jgi:hypothetical protein
MKKKKVEYISKKEWDALVNMGATVENDTIITYECDINGAPTGGEFLLKCKENN